ncbi:MAG: glycosyltransferase [Candidatus Nealsonbacteria bacterium]
MNQATSVSIIIACFERALELQKLLSSLKKIEFKEPLEIIVVDDGSRNCRAIKTVADKFQCSLIRLDKNLGPALARNIGAKTAKGKFLWFLDSDTEVNDPHLLNTLVKCFKQNKSLAGVGGEIIKINDKFYALNHLYLPNWLFIVKYVPINKQFEVRPRFIGTNNLLVLKKDFLLIGGFSPYFNMFEDNDLCLRLARLGKSFLVRNDTCVIHHYSSSGREGGKFCFFNKTWSYVLTMHISRMKILFLYYPWMLPILPLLDVICTPVLLLYQVFFSPMRSNDSFKKKSKNSSKSFLAFVFISLMAMFLTWLVAWKLLIQSLIIGKKAVIGKK